MRMDKSKQLAWKTRKLYYLPLRGGSNESVGHHDICHYDMPNKKVGKAICLIKVITDTILQYLSKTRAYTGWTYFRTYFTPRKEQSSDI